MNQTDVMLKIVEMAQVGSAMAPSDAISNLAILIDRLDMAHPDYENDVAVILGIGACIWNMEQALREQL